MKNNPFKFLDSYTKADLNIFFGREKETEEIYSRLIYGKLLLVYGPSGSGKTSLLQCGVANRLGEHNWRPVFIRRKRNIVSLLNLAYIRAHAYLQSIAGFESFNLFISPLIVSRLAIIPVRYYSKIQN